MNTGMDQRALDFIINESHQGAGDMVTINAQIEAIAANLKAVHLSTAATNIDARLATWRTDWTGMVAALNELNTRVTEVKKHMVEGDQWTEQASRGQ